MREITDQTTRGIILLGISAVLGIAATIGLVWYGMSHVSADTARIWALLATALLPVVGVLSFRLGRIESGATLRGLDVGVTQVMRAAVDTADVRAGAVGKMRQAAQPQVIDAIQLPEPATFQIRQQLSERVVEL